MHQGRIDNREEKKEQNAVIWLQWCGNNYGFSGAFEIGLLLPLGRSEAAEIAFKVLGVLFGAEAAGKGQGESFADLGILIWRSSSTSSLRKRKGVRILSCPNLGSVYKISG